MNPAEEDNADKVRNVWRRNNNGMPYHSQATSPLNEAAEDTGEDGDVLTVDVVEVPDNEAPSWRETFCRKIGLIRSRQTAPSVDDNLFRTSSRLRSEIASSLPSWVCRKRCGLSRGSPRHFLIILSRTSVPEFDGG